ncbi:unnamed protein product [Schistosoma mansoni]|uniref:Smp_205700 n=1 Tax=Schistosoma mansoni TaxID=6183 RepID=G4M232_SCHMA|nr:unnamed protein product [Schistosoma mansoni]|eukprot:XP_018644765.1 unnamed protein product [Schistosoma mansoni]
MFQMNRFLIKGLMMMMMMMMMMVMMMMMIFEIHWLLMKSLVNLRKIFHVNEIVVKHVMLLVFTMHTFAQRRSYFNYE